MKLVDGNMAAEAARVKPATIRQWAKRGKLTKRGVERGRVLYDLDEVYTCERDTRRRHAVKRNGQASLTPVTL